MKPQEWTLMCRNYVWHAKPGEMVHTGKSSDPIRVLEAEPVEREREEMLNTLTELRPIDLPEHCDCGVCKAWKAAEAILHRHGRLS